VGKICVEKFLVEGDKEWGCRSDGDKGNGGQDILETVFLPRHGGGGNVLVKDVNIIVSSVQETKKGAWLVDLFRRVDQQELDRIEVLEIGRGEKDGVEHGGRVRSVEKRKKKVQKKTRTTRVASVEREYNDQGETGNRGNFESIADEPKPANAQNAWDIEKTSPDLTDDKIITRTLANGSVVSSKTKSTVEDEDEGGAL